MEIIKSIDHLMDNLMDRFPPEIRMVWGNHFNDCTSFGNRNLLHNDLQQLAI